MTIRNDLIIMLCLQCPRRDNVCKEQPTYVDAYRCKWDEANRLGLKLEEEYQKMTRR